MRLKYPMYGCTLAIHEIQAERQSSGSLCRGSPSPQSRECFPLGVIEWKLVHKILQLSLNCLSPVLGFFLTRAMLSVLPFGKHDSGTQAKYPGSKGLLIDPIYFDPAKMEKFV